MALVRPQPGADIAVARARVSRVRATRGDVARWLDGVPVETLGLGPDEILYVPRLDIRLPGQEFDGGGGRIPERIVAELRALLAGAQRGSGLRFVPGRPYRFTGRASYFAWLAALWICDGSEAARAAFQAATGEESLARWQRRAVLPDGAALVSMAARLAEAGAAARWIARLEPADVEQAFRSVEAWFGIRIERAVREGTVPVETARRRAAVAGPMPRLAPIGKRLAAAGNDWRALAPPARALLVTLALVADAPARTVPGQAGIIAEIASLAQSIPAPIRTVPAAAPERFAVREQPLPKSRASEPWGRAKALRRRSSPLSAPTEAPVPARGPAQRVALPSVEAPRPTTPEILTPEALGVPATMAPSPPTPPAPLPYLVAPDQRFDTGYGGLFFLLNAFVALGLYPDFTRPLGARLAPSPLWLADRIGRYWFGRAYRRDPLAAWIAAHAAPGRLPREWRPEPAWLAGFPAKGIAFHRDRDRATLWSPADFPLADGPTERIARPLRARLAVDPPKLPRRTSDRWAACLALYLDARLRAVAGCGLSALALPAEIRTLDLDLRARFRLDCHPIALRIAGLDRNPGWQPAEGRSFAFVFA